MRCKFTNAWPSLTTASIGNCRCGYQIGLVYEQLQQWDKATNYYTHITAKQKEVTAAGNPPSLSELCEMAQWRMDYIAWAEKARQANHEFERSALYNSSTNKTSIQ